MCLCGWMCASVHIETEKVVSCSALPLFTYSLERGSFSEPSSRLVTSKPLFSSPLALGMTGTQVMAGVGDLDSDPHS